ncbi:MAG: ATP synthase F1 subunit delta [Candidatus Komeilibacteria bacterium]|nr:ATP synthase F1 subunit delta [Candidatus Komeilibacteria bacterium]
MSATPVKIKVLAAAAIAGLLEEKSDKKVINNLVEYIRRHRLQSWIPALLREAEFKYRQGQPTKPVRVFSRYELTAAQLKEVKRTVSKEIGDDLEIINIVDEQLLGGIRVRFEDQLWDMSVRGRLERLASDLKP